MNYVCRAVFVNDDRSEERFTYYGEDNHQSPEAAWDGMDALMDKLDVDWDFFAGICTLDSENEDDLQGFMFEGFEVVETPTYQETSNQ